MSLSKKVIKTFLILSSTLCQLAPASKTEFEGFSFHIHRDPEQFSPESLGKGSSSYLAQNIYRALFIYSDKKGLIPAGARSCQRKGLTYQCRLNKKYWSDGRLIQANDYVKSWKKIIKDGKDLESLETLLKLKNAKKILKQKVKMDRLGLSAPEPNLLSITLETADSDFLYRLVHPGLSPIHPDDFSSNNRPNKRKTLPKERKYSGPYRIKQLRAGRWVELSPNPYFDGAKNRPEVRVYFIDEGTTALNLFLSKKLSLLRHLDVRLIPKYQKDPRFFQVPLSRFDYIAINPKSFPDRSDRMKIATSLDFRGLEKIYHARGRPGCPAIHPQHFTGDFCLKLSPLSPRVQDKFRKAPPTKLVFSSSGGDSIRMGMEWYQEEWRKNLGLKVILKSEDQKVFLSKVQAIEKPDLFRKGLPLDRPTCLAALENFESQNPNNYIGLNNQTFDNLILKMQGTQSQAKLKSLCSKALKQLIETYTLIPQGLIYFSMLKSPNFKGFEFNQLGHLHLDGLKRKRPRTNSD